MIAAATTTTTIHGKDTWPALATTPPSTAAVSPGSTNPTNSASSANTTSPTRPYTGNPRSPSSQSVNRPILNRPHDDHPPALPPRNPCYHYTPVRPGHAAGGCQPTLMLTVCRPVEPFGAGGACGLDLRVALGVERADLQDVVAARRVPGPVPLPPGVDRRVRGQRRLLPRAPIDADLDLRHPDVLVPRHPGDGDLTSRRLRPRYVDPRRQLDRPELGPAARRPVRPRTGRTGSPRCRSATSSPTRTRTAPVRRSAPGTRAPTATAARSSRTRAWTRGRRSACSAAYRR